MFQRLLHKNNKSFFLFGPLGTGKTEWVKANFPEALYIDLVEARTYLEFLNHPERLEKLIPQGFSDWIVIDEVQKVPALLNEVHRLIEKYHYKFVLTGSSARSLRKKGVNLLAGRALTFHMHPLTIQEVGNDFDLQKAITYGMLPSVFSESSPKLYLESYVKTYLREEVFHEGLTRNLAAFSRFLEVASFSQGQPLNMSEVARDSSCSRKVVESYFEILEDMLLSWRLNVFTKRAKRDLTAHPKFYYFDTGVFRILRPKGPFDKPEEIDGVALETLFLQHLKALNDYLQLEFELFYWRTTYGHEVDFVLYGPKGIFAFEIKRSRSLTSRDLTSLSQFQEDYPEAKLYIIFGGNRREYYGNITAIPFQEALTSLPDLLK